LDLNKQCTDVPSHVPVISLASEVGPLVTSIGNACRNIGFFSISDHGVPDELINRLKKISEDFFSLPMEVKREIEMSKGGKAWYYMSYIESTLTVLSSLFFSKKYFFLPAGGDILVWEKNSPRGGLMKRKAFTSGVNY